MAFLQIYSALMDSEDSFQNSSNINEQQYSEKVGLRPIFFLHKRVSLLQDKQYHLILRAEHICLFLADTSPQDKHNSKEWELPETSSLL